MEEKFNDLITDIVLFDDELAKLAEEENDWSNAETDGVGDINE